MVSGALLIDKPAGMTSSQVVSKIKWALINADYAPKGFKIGHGGTLDPFATGALLVFLGEATKLADTYLHSKKAYDGIITLGSNTDSGDLTGNIQSNAVIPVLSQSEWQKLSDSFVHSNYLQVPPMFSAKKRDGVPLYELARRGIEIDREPISKKIYSYLVNSRDPEKSELSFSVQCESGTYIRVLAEDLAKKAGTLAHLKSLRRIMSSDVLFEQCLPLTETLDLIDSQSLKIEYFDHFRPLSKLASHIPSFEISVESSERLWNGIQAEVGALSAKCLELSLEQRYAIAKQNSVPIALFERLKNTGEFRLQRIFNEARLRD